MPNISIQITNLPQIRAAFRRAPQLMTEELNTAIRRSVLEIEGESKKNTPVDTGTLRGSTRSIFSNFRGEVGTNVFYDLFVHGGTRYMKARPYLLQAVQTKEASVQGEMENAVQRVLNKIGSES